MSKFKNVKIIIGDECYKEYKITNITDNIFEYQDDTCLNKLEISNDKIIFIRESDEFLLIMDSTKDNAYYKLKDLNYELDIKINYFDQREEDNKLIISYQLETNDKEISLILEGE